MCLIMPLASSKPNPISQQPVITLKGPVCLIKNGWHIRGLIYAGWKNPQICILFLNLEKAVFVTLINSNIQMKPREYYEVFVETGAKSKCSNAGCFCGKDGICVMWLVILSRGSRVVFWGHVWESKLTAVWSLVPLCYMYQSCSFTRFNLPVINSLEGVQSLDIRYRYLALWCGIVDPSSENDPAVDQVPSVLISMFHYCLALCLCVPYLHRQMSSPAHSDESNWKQQREPVPLWIL